MRTKATLAICLLCLTLTAGLAQGETLDGKYYFGEMKAAMITVLEENQELINHTPDGAVKSEKLAPQAVYGRAYETFTEIAGDDFSLRKLGEDQAAIAQGLATLLQAGRITIAKSQKWINTEPDGSVKLKKFIPAVFGRLVAAEFATRTGVNIKQTTLGQNGYGARNEYNQPDGWEQAALERVMDEGWERNKGFGESVDGGYRLLKPVYIKKACLGCHGDGIGEKGPYGHAKEGYKVGEIRGGISVHMPKG
jgi:hypothetical protein